MADIRQLALEFVLADEEAKLTSIAKQTALELETAPANTNPVARWVESVQPWMPSKNGEEEDGHDLPDWTSRAKALEYLSRTLEYLGKDVLKPSQVKLLVAFFGAMFDVDHKAGVMASATALSRIIDMKSFQPSSAVDIIEKLCSLKDDFPRQVASTRLGVYKLLKSLITSSEVQRDLVKRQSPSFEFMAQLIELCRNERDPDCLMVWFDIQTTFLTQFNPTPELLEEVYGAFKAYYPITLPRTAKSTITPEELKSRLRACFSCNSNLAKHTFPFLVGKLDQGDGVTVNVKIDVLKTIHACIEQYDDPKESVVPYANRIWGSLKYEVRNGEIEDTIWATLEVLKALTTRLDGDDLRDYILNVTRDCVGDLASAMYCGPAGRLLISVLSASPVAFVLMVAPTVTHIKENLRHPKSLTHSQDLFKLLGVVLQTRLLLMDLHIDEETQKDFAAVDSAFTSLYHDVFKSTLEKGVVPNPSDEDVKITTAAVHGAAILVCQKPTLTTMAAAGAETETKSLLSNETCSEICNSLYSIISNYYGPHGGLTPGTDEMVNKTTEALQRAIVAYPEGFQPLVMQYQNLLVSQRASSTEDRVELIQGFGSALAFIGCSEFPKSSKYGTFQFLCLSGAFIPELLLAIQNGSDPKIWCAAIASIQSVFRYFSDTLTKMEAKRDQIYNGAESKFADEYASWLEAMAKYKGLLGMADGLGSTDYSELAADLPDSPTQAHKVYLNIGYELIKTLYQLSTSGQQELSLTSQYTGQNGRFEHQYLHLLSGFGGFLIHELSEAQQLDMLFSKRALDLFHEGELNIETVQSWNWLINSRVNTLMFGILEAARPAVVTQIFGNGIGQNLLLTGINPTTPIQDATTMAISRSALSILSNRYKLEGEESLIVSIEQQLSSALSNETVVGQGLIDQIVSILAVSAGFLRRHNGKHIQGLVALIRDLPSNKSLGFTIARRFEIVVAPQDFLKKENYAVIRPLWVQKVYVEIVKHLLENANDISLDPLAKSSHGVASLFMIKHMSFSIYEEDVDLILRVAITTAQTLGVSQESLAALTVIKSVLAEAPEKAQGHIRSLINICTSTSGTATASIKQTSRPDWLPTEALPQSANAEVAAHLGKISLDILAGLPRLYESRHLLSYTGQVDRQLSIACGHKVREIRISARIARTAWSEVN